MLLDRLTRWFRRKSAPPAPTDGWRTGFVDAYHKHHEPTAAELLGQLKNTEFACASVNAAVCAAYPPRLYVATARDRAIKCKTKALPLAAEERLRSAAHLHPATKAADRIEEVTEHPLLTLLRAVNPLLNSFDLWELTQFYLEVHGSAFWLLETSAVLGVPEQIWILPSQNVRVCRAADSP